MYTHICMYVGGVVKHNKQKQVLQEIIRRENGCVRRED